MVSSTTDWRSPSIASSLHYNWQKAADVQVLGKGAMIAMHVAVAWPHLTIVSVLDILVVAFIIYEFLAQIRGTRAALILVGATVTGLTFYFSRVFALTTLNWLIARFVPYAAFILIVIFAPEIREALARLGRRLT